MMMSSLSLALVATLAGVQAQGEVGYCSNFNSCETCLNNSFCGWCSPSPVIFSDGHAGTRCMDQRIQDWDCHHLYQTTKCVPGYICNSATGQCVQTVAGEGSRQDECEASCKKNVIYVCNQVTLTCDEAPPGTAGGTSEEVCNSTCVAPPSPAPTPKIYACNETTHACEVVEPGTAGGASEEVCKASCASASPGPSGSPGPSSSPSPSGSPGPSSSPSPANTKGFLCDKTIGVCSEVAANTTGASSSMDSCQSSCLAAVYICNKTTYTCDEAGPGAPGSTSKHNCDEACIKPTPQPVPSDIQGEYRGLQINSGFVKGEFDVSITNSSVSVTDPSGAVSVYDASILDSTLQLVLKSGEGQVGATLMGIYEKGQDGPETKHLTVAVSEPNGDAPTSLETGLLAPESEYVLVACKNEQNCKFGSIARRLSSSSGRIQLPRSLQSEVTVKGHASDPCNPYLNCSVCLEQPLCGWCTQPVEYEDGSTGAQCAGFNPDGSVPEYQCKGLYKRTDCNEYVCDPETYTCRPTKDGESGTSNATCQASCKAPADVFLCNRTSWTCEKATPGTQGATAEGLCHQQCVEPVPPKPNNGTPGVMMGYWRGLEVSQGYTQGEFDLKLNDSYALMMRPDGTWIEAQVGTGGGADLWFLVTGATDVSLVGKTFKALYQNAKGPVTTFMTLALGAPNADAPKAFDSAMKGADGEEYIFVKCDSGNCDFSPAFDGNMDTTKAPASVTTTKTPAAATTKATTPAAAGQCAASVDDCAKEAENHPSTGVTHDPACAAGGMGCNAYGKDCCKFCGFGAFPACPTINADDTTTCASTAEQCSTAAIQYGETLTFNADCSTGGMGCNAHALDCCQFCGFGHFPACPSATEDAAIMGNTMGAPEDAAGPLGGLVIGGVASAAFVAAAVVVGMNMKKSKKVAAPGLQDGLLDNEVSMGSAERH